MPRIVNMNDNIKVGTIAAFPMDNIPEGWLICNGAEYFKHDFPELANYLGDTYGIPSDPRKFKVPDFQGKFLRGYGINSNPIGQVQGDAIRNITGGIYNICETFAFTGWCSDVFYKIGVGSGHTPHDIKFNWTNADGAIFDASRVVPVANENRPINMAVVYCIKY